MNIDSINIYKVNVPFNFTCSHSQKDATSADNIVVEMTTSHEGLKGYGEGGPRLYVTGETQTSAIDAVIEMASFDRFPWHLEDVGQIWDFVESVSGKKNQNSALCATEMALLDLLAKKEGQNVLHFLPKDYFMNEVRYSGTLFLLDQERLLKWCKVGKQLSIQEVRLKMGQDHEANAHALKVARETLGPVCDLRVDVNMGWDLKLAEAHLPLLKFYSVSILEQPLWPDDSVWGELAAMVKANGLKLMADESACSIEDVEAIIAQGHFDIINVRLSKCGGFYNSLKIIKRIREAGLNYQIGCQLGETGILSAAGRALSVVSSDALYHDGSYDAFLLKENLTTEDVTFDHKGKAAPLKNPGLGIEINQKNLQKFAEYLVTIERPLLNVSGLPAQKEVLSHAVQ
jgi:muconate cycloisomerase